MKKSTKSKSYSAYKLVIYFRDKPSGESRAFYSMKDPDKCMAKLEHLLLVRFRGRYVTALIYDNDEAGQLRAKWVGDTREL